MFNLILRWCNQDLSPVVTNSDGGFYNKKSLEQNLDLVMEGHPDKKFQRS